MNQIYSFSSDKSSNLIDLCSDSDSSMKSPIQNSTERSFNNTPIDLTQSSTSSSDAMFSSPIGGIFYSPLVKHDNNSQEELKANESNMKYIYSQENFLDQSLNLLSKVSDTILSGGGMRYDAYELLYEVHAPHQRKFIGESFWIMNMFEDSDKDCSDDESGYSFEAAATDSDCAKALSYPVYTRALYVDTKSIEGLSHNG